MNKKRDVPTALQSLLKLDATLSKAFCIAASKIVQVDRMKNTFSTLGVSCHGLLWLGGWLIYVWLWWRRDLFQMQVNFYLALIIDILAIALLKAYFRRRRPPGNKLSKFQAMGPDAYSFPSGHVSRAFLIYLFFTFLSPVGTFWSIVILVWALSVAVSRLMLHMHYILDIIGGLALAFVTFSFISWFWISKETSFWLIQYITDERLDEGEFHLYHSHESD